MIKRLRPDVLRLSLGLLISVLFLAATVISVDAATFVATMRRLQWPLVGLAVVLSMLEISVRAVRWQSLLRPHTTVNLADSFLYICVGHFANAMLPFRLGDAARAHLAGRRFGANRLTVFGTIIIERLADGVLLLCALLLTAAVGVAAALDSLATLATAALACVGLAIIGFIVRERFYRLVTRVVPGAGHAAKALLSALDGIRSPGQLAILAGTTGASYVAATAIMFVLLTAAGAQAPWWVSAIAIGAMTLSTVIPAAPGAVGTYELAGTATLVAFKVPPDAALAAVIVVHVTATVPAAIIGLATTMVMHVNVIGLRSRESDPFPALAAPDPG